MKQISAMVRAKNEEQFLYPSVKSIIDHVDEVVIVDNLSTDATPSIARSLAEEYPDKVALYHYKHEVARVGLENKKLAQNPLSRRFSPNLLANYYNWCLRRCTKEYVLKWDADSIATESFYRFLKQWRHSDKEILIFRGANIHPDLQHLVAAVVQDKDQSQTENTITFANWISPYTDFHVSLFPKKKAHYSCAFWWCERLESPYIRPDYICQPVGVSFVHLKYCKHDPMGNMSPELHQTLMGIRPGATITKEMAHALRKFGILC